MRIESIALRMSPIALLLACNDVPADATDYAVKVTQSEAAAQAVKVDFLWVIDDSSSMCQEQTSLASSFESFVGRLESFTALDYRLAVVTTDMITDGFVGRFRAEAATYFPASCREATPTVCVDPTRFEDALVSHPELVSQCDDPATCGCGDGFACSFGNDLGQILNCNGSVNSDCRKTCATSPECDAFFLGGAAGAECAADSSRCQFRCNTEADVGSGVNGCVRRPVTAGCPGPEALKAALIAGAGRFCDDGKACGDDTDCAGGSCRAPNHPWLVPATARDLFRCVGVVGADQGIVKGMEQGINAALWSLNRAQTAPNADQARSFLRDDAYLVVVMISDEEDCSTADCGVDPKDGVWRCAASIRKEDYARCGCMADARSGGPLLPVSDAVNQLKSVKADPGKVVVAAIVGDSVAPTAAERDVERQLYRESECGLCDDPNNQFGRAGNSSICSSTSGKADHGRRYAELVSAFGANGVLTNICNDEGIGPALDVIADRIITVLNKVCLTRPIEDVADLSVQVLGPMGVCADGSACCQQGATECTPSACADGTTCKGTPRSLDTATGTPAWRLVLTSECPSLTPSGAVPVSNAVVFDERLPAGARVEIDYLADRGGARPGGALLGSAP
ncbi:MAG: hypothetical protein IV100_12935 [Myxococcales bacterium]|nr:hypothetical protein [Myxococcales bacterium]